MMNHEFISNPTVRVLRWDEKLLIFPSLLMFRIHDTIQVVKEESTSHLSIINHKSWVGNSAPIPFECCSSNPDYFRIVVCDALHSLNLFLPHNNQILSKLIPEYFHSCYNCNYKADPTSDPKIIVIVEVFRKTVYIDKPATTEEEKINRGELAAAVKLQAEEELGDQYLQDEEDYSKLALEGILGNLLEHLLIKGGYQLSTLATIDELAQVKAAIKLLIFNGRRFGEDDCPICYEGFCQGQHIARMPCSHIFHKNCAFKWLPRCGSCPLCRSGCKTSIL